MQEEFQQHISQQFNEDLAELTRQLLHMGGLVEQQLSLATRALLDSDTALADRVIRQEEQVNDLDLALGEACPRMLALRQPAASDLRMVMAISRCVSDLERIGDEADKIADMARTLSTDKSPCGYVEVRRMGQHVGSMLHDVLHAFVRQDISQALAVKARDEEVDQEYGSAMRTLITFMMEEPRTISRVLNILWVLRALERIGDHTCNIAEQVVYLAQGRDIRHASPDELDELTRQQH